MDTAGLARRIQRTFGDEDQIQILLTDIYDWINDGQLKIVRDTSCLQQTAPFNVDPTTVANGFSLPADFLDVKRIYFNSIPLTKIEKDTIDTRYGGIPPMTVPNPGFFYLDGAKFYLYPNPTTGGTGILSMVYVVVPTTVVSTGDALAIPQALHEDLFNYCMMRARNLDQDYQGEGKAKQAYEEGMSDSRQEQDQRIEQYPVIRDYVGDLW